ncbi:MAG TPA: thermopsin family protease [Thermoplasmata archaeon]|nr:thermopsin family protease [Thermoplasmata archaeon]
MRILPALLVVAIIAGATGIPFVHSSLARPAHSPSFLTAPSYLVDNLVVKPSRTSFDSSHLTAAAAVSGTPVNPLRYRTTEPAPMGIADYGISPASSPYSYNTSKFLGTVQVGSALAWGYNPVGKFNTSSVTFQLNVMLIITNGTTNVTYWVQGIIALSTKNSSVNFEDEIWNATGARTLAGNAIQGNGSLAGGSYYYVPPRATNLPGNWVRLSQPYNVSIELTTESLQGTPTVLFQYNDGFGWITFDTAKIAWALAWADSGFHVDGYRLAVPSVPVFYDAEWVYCGWGGGEIANNNASNIFMVLQFWNGHNLQAVSNAYDMGIDTGELIGNVTTSLVAYPATGLPASHLGAGKGTLGVLYSQAELSRLNVQSQLVPNGSLLLGGASVQFSGGAINLTLQPGSYRLTLENGSRIVESRAVLLSAGSSLSITMPTPQGVTLRATTLPSGTSWSVLVAGKIHRSSNLTINLLLSNGSYSYRVLPVPGFVPGSYNGTLSVLGPIDFTIDFTAFVFTVVGQELGLPAGESWSFAASGATYSSSNSTILAQFPNGTFQFTVGGIYGYTANPFAGSFTVSGAPTIFSVAFSPELGFLTGTLYPTAANLTVDGVPDLVGADGTFNLSLAPGTHEVNASSHGFSQYTNFVKISPGTASTLTIVLLKLPGSVQSRPQLISGSLAVLAEVSVGIGAILAVGLFAIVRRHRR